MAGFNYDPRSNSTDVKFLEKTKEVFEKIPMHTKRINKYTIVSCSQPDKIEKYEKILS